MASILTSSTLSPNQVPISNSLISPSSSQSKFFLRPSKPRFHHNLRVSSSSPPPSLLPTPHPSNPNNPFSPTIAPNSTRSIASILALGLSISKLFAEITHGVSSKISQLLTTPTPVELSAIRKLQGNLACSVGPLFFAAMSSPGTLNSPLTVVASGMAKWLEIYSGVLLVRVLLSWFPNIPWDRQPLSAIRDLCDPYLNMFKNLIPPLFDRLDVSPLLAFTVLGTLSAILASSR